MVDRLTWTQKAFKDALKALSSYEERLLAAENKLASHATPASSSSSTSGSRATSDGPIVSAVPLKRTSRSSFPENPRNLRSKRDLVVEVSKSKK